MKKILFLLVLCAFSATAFGDDGNDEALLRNIKLNLWPTAYRTQDADLLARILHDSFEMIDANGVRSTREQELDYVRNNQWDPGEFEYLIERLEIYEGGFAVVDGTGNAEKYTYKSSNFFVKQDGVWKAIASHVSGYKQKE